MRLDRSFRFRGDRTYLHSATLFDDLLQLRSPHVTDIDLKFHRETGKQVRYVDVLPPNCESVAEWRDANGKVHVIERDEPIVETGTYDEPALVRMLEVDGRTVRIPAVTPSFSRSEAMIAGFKALLQAVYPEHKRKYVFARIRLAHCPQAAVEISYTRDLGGFFQGDIRENGQVMGQIFFGVWQ